MIMSMQDWNVLHPITTNGAVIRPASYSKPETRYYCDNTA